MSDTTSEGMLLNFDGWLGQQDEQTRAGISAHLNAYPDPIRTNEKQRLASMFAVSEATGLPLDTVNSQWDTVRGGFAEKQGGEFLAAKDDETKFFGALKTRAAKQRDERLLIQGGDTADAAGVKSQNASLQNSVLRGAITGRTAGESFLDWQKAAATDPKFRAERADYYQTQARAMHDALSQRFQPVLGLARGAFVAISADETGQAAVDLLPKVDALSDPQRRDFLAAVRVLADAAPDKERATFWGNLNKSAQRSVTGAAYGFATFMDQAAAAQNEQDMGLALDTKTLEFTRSAFDATLKRNNLASDLRRIQESNYSPIRDVFPDGWKGVEHAAYMGASAPAYMALAMVPGVGIPATFATLAGQGYDQERFRLLDAGKSDVEASQAAMTIAPVAAVPETALMMLGNTAMLGKLPFFNRAMLAIGDAAGGGATGFIARAVGRGAFDVASMRTQELMQPIVEAAASGLDKDMPGVVWRNGQDGVLDGWWSKTGETFLSMLPFAIAGAGDGGAGRVEALSKASDLQLRAFGAQTDDIAAFRTSVEKGPASAADAAEKLVTNRDGNSDAAKAAVDELQRAEQQRAANAAKINQSAMSDAGVARVVRDGEGWSLVHENGDVSRVGSAQAAQSIVEDLRQASHTAEAQALVSLIDDWHGKTPEGTKRQTTLTGDTLTTDGQKLFRSRNGAVLEEDMTPEHLAELQRQATMDAQATGNEDVLHVVNGSNVVEFGDRVAEGAREVVQRLEINQGDSPVITFLHESVEADARAGIASGALTQEAIGRAIAEVAPLFDPAKARDDSERAFRERVQRVAAGEANPTETRETLTELAVADILGRRKDGEAFPAGSVSAGLDAAVANATDAKAAKELGGIRAFLRAVRDKFRAIFGTVAALKKGRREGKTTEFDALINKVLGRDKQAAHDDASIKEAQAMADAAGLEYKAPSAADEAAGIAFSVTRVEDVQRAKLDEARDAVLKAEELQNEISGLEAKVESLRSIENRTREDESSLTLTKILIRTRKRTLEKYVEIGRAYPGGLNDAKREAAGGAAFRLSPASSVDLIQKRIDSALAKDPERRRELARMATERLQKLRAGFVAGVEEKRTTGELDKEQAFRQADFLKAELEKIGLDAADASRSKEYKDLIASRRFQDVFGTLTDHGWHEEDAIKMAQHLGEREREMFLAKVKLASNAAREAAYEWRREADATQAKDWSARSSQIRDLRAYNAALSVLPPELRASVGGFIQIAQLGEKGRQREISARLDKAFGLVEKWLRKENADALDKLIEKATPTGGPGERAGGKITVEGHRIFGEVGKVRDLSEADAAARLAGIDSEIEAESIKATPDRKALVDLYEKRQILLAFGDFANKSAADGDAAVKWLSAIYTTGRNAWRAIVEQRETDRATRRESAITEVGGPGALKERQTAKADEGKAGQTGKVLSFFGPKHQSWAQRLGSIFGTKSETAQHYENAVTKAFHGLTERMIGRRTEQRDALLRIFGAKSWWQAQDGLLKLQERVEKSGVMKLEGRKLETITLPLDTAQNIVDGKATPEAFGLQKADVAALEVAVNDVLSDPKNRAKTVSVDTTAAAGKPVEQLISQLEAVHLTMLAMQPMYRDAMDKHGWTADSLAQMEKFLSPEAKAIRQWLFERYDKEYAGLNKVYQSMYGIDLPKVEFYAPGYFETAGEAADMDPLGGGVDPAGMTSGFLRQRKQHSAEPVLVDALQTYWNHAKMTEHWKALAPVVQELRSVFGSVDVRHAITAHEGEQAHRDLIAWVEKFEKGGVRDAQTNRWVGRVTTALTRAGLSLNVGTWLKHLPNAFASLAEVPAGDFMRGMVRVMSGQAEASLAQIWKSDAIRNRLLNSYTPDLRQVAMGANAADVGKTFLRIGDALDWGVARIPWVAGAFTTFSAAVAHEYHFSEASKAGMDEASALRYAEEKTALTIARSAQPETIDRKSLAELERTGAARLMMLFHTPERQQWGTAFSAMHDALTGKGSKADAARKLFATWVVGPVLMQTMVGLWRYLITDEDAETAWDWKRYAGAVAMGPSSGIFGLGQIVEAAVHHFTGAHGSKAGEIFADMMAQAIKAGKHVADGETTFRDALELFAAAGMITGAGTDIPAEGLKVAKRLFDAAHGLTTDKEELHKEKHAKH